MPHRLSHRRILIGVAMGVIALSVGLAATFYWSLPNWCILATLLGIPMGYIHLVIVPRQKALLRPYEQRESTEDLWRQRFPDDGLPQFERFLQIFCAAFTFKAAWRFRFTPDDRILAIYHALNPPEDSIADAMELETLTKDLQKHYHLDLPAIWREDLNLGEVYAQTRSV